MGKKVSMTLDKLLVELAGKSVYDIAIEVELDGKDLIIPPEVASLMAVDNQGRLRPYINTSGEITEASAASIAGFTGGTADGTRMGLPLYWGADGAAVGYVGSRGWKPIVPVTVTADGAGNPPVTEIIAAVAGKYFDIMLWWTVDTVSGAGQYEHNFREATAAPAVVSPDWTAVIIPAAAGATQPGHTYGARIQTVNDNTNFGIADGANGDWPNSSNVTFWGFYRQL